MNNVITNPYRKTMAIAAKLSEYLQSREDDVTLQDMIFIRGSLKAVMKEIVGEENPLFNISEAWNGGVHITCSVVKSNEEAFLVDEYKTAVESRLTFILYRSFAREMSKILNDAGHQMSYNGTRAMLTSNDRSDLIAKLNLISQIEFSQEYMVEAISDYNLYVQQLELRMTQEERAEFNEKSRKGIGAKIMLANAVDLDKDVIESQIVEAQDKLQNSLVGRTWGWEVEAPNPGEFTTPAGVEAGSDGSVESYEEADEDCECECRSCTYHSCDCDDCDSYNEDPDHCGDSECRKERSYEFRTVGGVTRALHPGLKNLLEQIGDTEKNETAGTHIHVYARDLDAFQIGIVLGAYALTQKVWDVLAGRDVNQDARCRTYANLVPADKVSYALRHKVLSHVGKFNAVNTHNVATDRGTLEFRQMDCNFNFKRISLMAFMARGLVEVAKRGAKLSDFMNITDLNGLIKVYAKYGFKYESETESIENPNGSRYNQSRKAPVTA